MAMRTVYYFIWSNLFLAAYYGICSAVATCEQGYSLSGSYCYKAVSSISSFGTASQDCRNNGGNLATISDAAADAVVAQLGNGLLIGARYSGNQYVWDDGTAYTYYNWDSGYPKNRQYYGECVIIQSNGKWINADCDRPNAPYVCQKRASDGPSPSLPNVCPQELEYTDSGVLTSPGYSENYGVSLSCTYLLLAKNGHNVSIEFTEAQLDDSDTITVYEGMTTAGKQLHQFIGNVTGLPITLTTTNDNKMFVEFKSSAASKGGLWRAEWATDSVDPVATTVAPQQDECPVFITYRGNGTLYSPGYPQEYGATLDCYYLLETNPIGLNITITLDEAQLTTTDFISFRDSTSQTPFATFQGTGAVQGASTSSQTDQVIMSFHSGAASHGKWKVTWKSAESSSAGCPSNPYYYNEGTITSEGYPNGYGTMLNCVYHLVVNTGHRIFLQFDVISTLQCCDLISIYDGQYKTPYANATYSGSHGPNEVAFLSSSNQLLIIFTTSDSHYASQVGWTARFRQIPG